MKKFLLALLFLLSLASFSWAGTVTGTLAGLGSETFLVTWTPLACGDVGSWMQIPKGKSFTVHVYGTFNSQTLTMMGTNDTTGSVTGVALTDLVGSSLALTAEGVKGILELPRYIRPSFSGSSGGALTVLIYVK